MAKGAKGAKKGMDALIGQYFVVLLGVLGQLGPLALKPNAQRRCMKQS